MMMIRACPSLLIATVVKDLVTPQVFRHAVDCVFVSYFLADFCEANLKNHFG